MTYEVELLIVAPTRSARDLRADVSALAADDPALRSAFVAGDERAIRVRAYTERPDRIVRLGLAAGRLRGVARPITTR